MCAGQKALPGLLQNFQYGPLFQLGRSGAQDGPHGPCRTPLLSDDLAQILLGDPQLVNNRLFAANLCDLNLFRLVHQRLRQVFDQFFQHEGPRVV